MNTCIRLLRRREEGLNLILLISRLRQMEVKKEGIRLEKSKKVSYFLQMLSHSIRTCVEFQAYRTAWEAYATYILWYTFILTKECFRIYRRKKGIRLEGCRIIWQNTKLELHFWLTGNKLWRVFKRVAQAVRVICNIKFHNWETIIYLIIVSIIFMPY